MVLFLRYFLGVGLIAVFGLSSCASDGRKLAPYVECRTTVEPNQTCQSTTTRPSSTSALQQEISQKSSFEITSSDFEPGAQMPEKLNCKDNLTPPSLSWSNVPEGTQELALALIDYTSYEEPLLVWLVAGIDPTVNQLDSNYLEIENLVETQNDWGNIGFGKPCLERLDEDDPDSIRDLQFRIYSLNSKSDLENGGHGNKSWAKVKSKSSESAAILMRYDPYFETSFESLPNTNKLELVEE